MISITPLPKISIRQIELHTHIHATESVEKVKNLIQHICCDQIQEKDLHIDFLSGVYGQKIGAVSVNIQRQAEMNAFIQSFTSQLSNEDKITLENEFERRLDEKLHFYMRINKQKMAKNQIVLATTPDVIQIILSIQIKTPKLLQARDHVKSFFNDIGLLPAQKMNP